MTSSISFRASLSSFPSSFRYSLFRLPSKVPARRFYTAGSTSSSSFSSCASSSSPSSFSASPPSLVHLSSSPCGRLGVITLDRPEARNAINTHFLACLDEAVQEAGRTIDPKTPSKATNDDC
eukprot:GHVT01081547.1.p1 GENE.GHVT01081547.1~~GHVT01081547.1.p1  ORF type:complete len:122 (-),score=35.44 GHVT01081547.1:650-1015(-)